MSERLYSLAEAEGLLPDLIPRLRAIQVAFATVQGEARYLPEPSLQDPKRPRLPMRMWKEALEHDRAIEILRTEIETLNKLGVELKDPHVGLIDFRHQRGGRVVYLCWRLGERRIDWWHELDSGFAGRKRLDRE